MTPEQEAALAPYIGQIVQGDCREVMASFPDGCFDAVVTDPPYGIGWYHDGTGGTYQVAPSLLITGDDEPFDPCFMLPLAPKLCLFGANHYADKLPPSAHWLVWDKRDGMGSTDQADAEMAWMTPPGLVRVVRHRWKGYVRDSERGSAKEHPTQKPVALMRWVLDELRVPPGGLILDPFMGSGTTAVACVQTGRGFVGIELSEDYCDIARRRVAEALLQPRLDFDAPPKPKQGEMPL